MSILIVDGLNMYRRAYEAYPQMSANGAQMGGVVGTLKMLRRLVFDNQVNRVYVVWEGGGSSKRRKLFSEYKAHRKPDKLNRFYDDDIPDSDENRMHQMVVLLSIIKKLPVCQLYVSDCEGDDVIAYLSRGPLKKDNKIIASSDRDFYQLLDECTRIWSFHKKSFYEASNVLEEFRITARNFALAKSLVGDASDNIPGVKGIGFKTCAKLFPILGTEEDVILQDVLSYAKVHVDESNHYQRVIDSWDDVERNWKLIYLSDTTLSPINSAKIDHAMDSFKPTMNRLEIVKIIVKEGLGTFDVNDLCMAFNCIDDVFQNS